MTITGWAAPSAFAKLGRSSHLLFPPRCRGDGFDHIAYAPSSYTLLMGSLDSWTLLVMVANDSSAVNGRLSRRLVVHIAGASSWLLEVVVLAGFGWRKRSVGLSRVHSSSKGVGSLGVRRSAVNIVPLGQSGDLVVGQLGQLVGDDGGSSLDEVTVGVHNINLT